MHWLSSLLNIFEGHELGQLVDPKEIQTNMRAESLKSSSSSA
jgi:hypothetical protein